MVQRIVVNASKLLLFADDGKTTVKYNIAKKTLSSLNSILLFSFFWTFFIPSRRKFRICKYVHLSCNYIAYNMYMYGSRRSRVRKRRLTLMSLGWLERNSNSVVPSSWLDRKRSSLKFKALGWQGMHTGITPS